jgi:hypothetical protein
LYVIGASTETGGGGVVLPAALGVRTGLPDFGLLRWGKLAEEMLGVMVVMLSADLVALRRTFGLMVATGMTLGVTVWVEVDSAARVLRGCVEALTDGTD